MFQVCSVWDSVITRVGATTLAKVVSASLEFRTGTSTDSPMALAMQLDSISAQGHESKCYLTPTSKATLQTDRLTKFIKYCGPSVRRLVLSLPDLPLEQEELRFRPYFQELSEAAPNLEVVQLRVVLRRDPDPENREIPVFFNPDPDPDPDDQSRKFRD